jgi:hypothetical protein
MSHIYNIYCDESCHLENDKQNAMVLGAVWCPLDRVKEIATHIRGIKNKHGINPFFEIKWTKVSPGKVQFYEEIVDYFFQEKDLHFRALIVPDKSKLRHSEFGQDHDTWYYKMYFDLLKVILSPKDGYRIYIDLKDTHTHEKLLKLHQVLSDEFYDFSRDIIQRVQIVRSHEVSILQITDLLSGAISYVNRGLSGNSAKEHLIALIRSRSGYTLQKTTLLREDKFNTFVWRAREV